MNLPFVLGLIEAGSQATKADLEPLILSSLPPNVRITGMHLFPFPSQTAFGDVPCASEGIEVARFQVPQT